MAGIKDIARLAGVSIGTVDRVIHNRGRCSAEARSKVEEAIKTLNYKPNIAARQLKKQEIYLLGIIQPHPEQDQGYWTHAKEAVSECRENLAISGLEIKSYFFDRHQPETYIQVLDDVVKDKCRGVLLPPLLPKETKSFLRKYSNLKVVFFDCPLEEAECLQSIYQEGKTSGAVAADLFVYKFNPVAKIAMIGFNSPHPYIQERLNSFSETLIKNGFMSPDCFYIPDDFNLEECKAYMFKNKIKLNNYEGIFIAKTGTYKYAKILNETKKQCAIIGYDLTPDNLSELKKGAIDVLISQNCKRQVEIGVQTLVDKLYFDTVSDKYKYMPIDLFTKNSILLSK